MNINELQPQLDTYRKAIAQVVQYRKEWPIAKELIYNTLKAIVKEGNIKAEVAKEEKVDGLEIIYLTFGKRESGIFERLGHTKRPFIKDGGYLFYAQIYNGKVSAWISEPLIENLTDRGAPKPIDFYAPSEITEELIVKHVVSFLAQMAEWEDKDLAHHEMGYKVQHK